ncbi:Zn-ribbon domain-containing OB-fold protein [Achromobacter aloeverae]
MTAQAQGAQSGGRSPYAIYVEHLRAGRLAYQYSRGADKAVFFPRVLCPYTGDDCLEWRVSSGLGTVYSTSVVHPRKGEPYNVALIDCDEGFRLMSRVEDLPASDVAIGLRVRLRVHAPDTEDDDPYPVFIPAE